MPFSYDPSAPPPDRPAAARRPTCARCRLPQATCLCGWVRPVAHRTEVLVLQHPDEADQAKGSARLLALSLQRCRVEVGEGFDRAALARWCDGAVLLYPPEPGTLTMAPMDAAGPPPKRLIVIDATWRKSLRMLMGHPLLQTLPRLSLPGALPDSDDAPIYAALRRAPRPGQRSTLEATCAALQQLEPEHADRCAGLLDAFAAWVAESAARRVRAGDASDVTA